MSDLPSKLPVEIRNAIRLLQGTFDRHQRKENICIVYLTVLFFVGVFLLITGAFVGTAGFVVPGALCETSIILPIKSLVTQRNKSMLFQSIPTWLVLATSPEQKDLVWKMLYQLYEKET